MTDPKAASVALRQLFAWFPESAPDGVMKSPCELSDVELRNLIDAAWRLSRRYRNGFLRGTSVEERRQWADEAAVALTLLASASAARCQPRALACSLIAWRR